MASAALSKPAAFYDVVPVNQRYARPHTHRPFEVFRKLGQGAGAGLLALSGADTMLAGGGAMAMDLTSLHGIAETLATGGFNGPLQILGALIIFIAAGRCIARFAGLLAIAAAFMLHMQGVGIGEVGSFAGDFVQRAAAAFDAFMAAPAA